MQRTLLILSGPSGVGKRQFVEAVRRALVARAVSIGEVQVLTARPVVRDTLAQGMRVLGTGEVQALTPARYVFGMVREEINAVDCDELDDALAQHQAVVVVPFYMLALQLMAHARVRAAVEQGVRIVSVFLSPFSESEISACSHPEHILPDIMRARQLGRALQEAVRARRMVESSATLGALYRTTTLLQELQARKQFEYVLILRNGHLPEVWDAEPPAGDAGAALERLVQLVMGE